MLGNFVIRMYDKQFFRILRQRYEDINSLLLITGRKKTIIVAILREVAAEANWKVSVTQGTGTSNQELVFTAAVNGTGCTALTPTFDKIGK